MHCTIVGSVSRAHTIDFCQATDIGVFFITYDLYLSLSADKNRTTKCGRVILLFAREKSVDICECCIMIGPQLFTMMMEWTREDVGHLLHKVTN